MSGDDDKLTFGGLELSLEDPEQSENQGQPANFMVNEEDLGVYTGPERRRARHDRRLVKDRREQLRFEPGRTSDRRSGTDRRNKKTPFG